MDTDSTGQCGNLITIAMLTESTGIFHRDWDKIFHGDSPSKHDISVGERKFSFTPIGFCERKKILYPMP